jgi:S1-C subfamily serine protease
VAGVIVESVESASWSDLGGLSAGDLIQKIDDTEIRNVTDFKSAMNVLAEKKPERVIFLVLRGVRTRFLYVEPEWSVSMNGATTQPTSVPTTQATKN